MKRYITRLTLLLTLFSTILLPPSATAAALSKNVCSKTVKKGQVRCMAVMRAKGSFAVANSPADGYTPADFKAAYGGTGAGASHVGIVVAYDAPNIKADLGTYSQRFGLPQLATCQSGQTTDCFTKIDQNGTAHYPPANASWALESSMDVEAVHAMCPHCRITLVEANSTGYADLSTAVDRAVTAGAKIVSNSYGAPENSLQTNYDSHYKHEGVVLTVSSGDSGYGTSWPASSPNVVAVGGTTLHMKNGKVVSESAWQGSGSGCSSIEPKPSWQHDTACKGRSVADLAADADPDTGAAVYDSYGASGQKGWFVLGGTSLAAPLVAGMLAANNLDTARLLTKPASFRDITAGQNGGCHTYLCNAQSGYDGPTGFGVLKL